MRMTSDLGVSSWMLVHELTDLDQYAPKGSGLDKKLLSTLTKADTQILYRQSAASMARFAELIPDVSAEEAAWATRLDVGVGLWRVGRLRALVHPMVGSTGYRLVNTDEGRRG